MRDSKLSLIAALAGRVVSLAALPLILSTCHFDIWVGELTDEDHLRPPPAPPTTVSGHFSVDQPIGVPGAAVSFFLGDESLLPDLKAQVADDGSFSLQVPGTQSYSSVYVYASSGAVALMGIVPQVPGATSVYDLPRQVVLGDAAPEMEPIDATATTITLLIEGRLRQQGNALSNLDPDSVASAISDVADHLSAEAAEGTGDGTGPFVTFTDMVNALLAEAANHPDSTIPVFLPPDQIAMAGSSLNPEFLTTYPVDYTGDGTPDDTTDAYEAAIQFAMASFTFNICYDPDLIRVVFQVNFNEGLLDGNCSPRSRTVWLDGIDPGDTMHLVGGVHREMVRCEDDPTYEFCATQADIDMTNLALSGDLGGWVPNQVQMYDDGTHGDATAGDLIYSLALDLPRGMRIGYKYTYGPSGSLWTGTEEWPGNQRLLELIDVNGDGMVVRRDNWGDEATNKDRSNLLQPSRGGKGAVLFSCGDTDAACCTAAQSPDGVAGCVDANHDGYLDFREIPVDLDGDCIPDRFPPAGPVTPLTVPCPQ